MHRLSALIVPSIRPPLRGVLLGMTFLFLSACATQPKLNFIGVSKGTFATDINNLKFETRFQKSDRELVAVVAFDAIDDGSSVMATWFSPDDRTRPVGRKVIETESGAEVVRFSMVNAKDWEPAPILIDIRASTDRWFGRAPLVATGSLQFFVGMTEEEIEQYKQEAANRNQ